MSIYSEPYAKGEWNYSFPIPQGLTATTIRVLNVGDRNIEIIVKGSYFRKTDGTGAVVDLQLDVEELAVPVTDGTLLVGGVDLLIANLDRSNTDSVDGLDSYKDATVDRTGSRNIFRTAGSAIKNLVDYSPNLDFRYRLKKNTSYAIISTVLNGAVDTSESIIYGLIRKED